VGASTQLMTALNGSPADDGNRLDLDLRARYRQPAHLDERARGARVAEELLAHWIDLRPVVDVRQEDRHLRHIREGRPTRGQHSTDVLERLSRLGNDVVAADEAAFGVHGDAARDEQEVSDADGIRVMADRLRLAFDSDLLA
jgi:predicted component of type VI protein secretion system